MRSKQEIEKAANEACDQLWYLRHMSTDRSSDPPLTAIGGEVVGRYAGVLDPSDVRTEGEICGRLATLRWVLGDDDGLLDT